MLTVFFAILGALENGRMHAFLAYREQILHSPLVLYALLPKLASGLGQEPKFLAYREQILHSPLVLSASLQRKLGSNSEGIAYFTQNWLASWDKCLHSLPTEYRSCIRLQFCTLRYQNWLVSWGQVPAFLACGELVLHSSPVLPASLRCKTRGLYYRREVLLTVGLFELKLT